MDLITLVAAITLTAFWVGVFYFAKSLKRLESAVERLEAGAEVVASNLASAAADAALRA